MTVLPTVASEHAATNCNIKVSICIPAYRQVDYLRDTLRSILEQDFDDYELILTDDSPDDSVERLLHEFDFWSRLRYHRNLSKLGSPGNWNYAIGLARGEYVKILHHDDRFSEPHSLRSFVDLLEKNPESDFGFSATIVSNVGNGRQHIHEPTAQQLQSLLVQPERLYLGNVIGAPSATIVRRRAQIQYDTQLKWLVDIDYYIRILQANKHFAYTNRPLICTPTNAGHQVTEECRFNGVVELSEYYRLFTKLSDDVRADGDIRRFWRRLFRKYLISSPADFARYGLPTPKPDDYFEALATVPQILLQAAALFYRAFTRIPLASSIDSSLRDLVRRHRF